MTLCISVVGYQYQYFEGPHCLHLHFLWNSWLSCHVTTWCRNSEHHNMKIESLYLQCIQFVNSTRAHPSSTKHCLIKLFRRYVGQDIFIFLRQETSWSPMSVIYSVLIVPEPGHWVQNIQICKKEYLSFPKVRKKLTLSFSHRRVCSFSHLFRNFHLQSLLYHL